MKDTFKEPCFSFGNRVLRLLWNFVEFAFFRLSPRPFFRWRVLLLRSFGAKIGNGVHIYPTVSTWAPWNLKVGNETGIGDGVVLYNQAVIAIGNRCVISQNSYLCTGSHDYLSSFFPLITKPITIEDHVWICAGSFIHPGVTLKMGCVVGACSVVTKDLSSWSVCAGNPCKFIKTRPPHQ